MVLAGAGYLAAVQDDAVIVTGKKHTEWAQQVWQILAAQGQTILKEGKVLESAEENLAELTSQVTTFAEKQLPILKALQVV